MAGMDEKTVKILLYINRQEALYRFLRDYFIPMLSDRGYSFADLLQAIASWAFSKELKAIAHQIWDAADRFLVNKKF
jgi:hypothetical protein